MARLRRQPRAFTLLELLVVMGILAIVALLVVPTLGAFSAGRELDNAAAQIVALTQYARTQAIGEGEVYRLNFDTTRGQYWLTLRQGETEQDVGREFGRIFTLPDEVESQWDGPTAGGVGYVDFDPTGRTDSVILRLTGRSGRVVQVACPSPTELFRIVEPGQPL